MSMNRFVGLGILALSAFAFSAACDDSSSGTTTGTTTTTTSTAASTGTTTGSTTGTTTSTGGATATNTSTGTSTGSTNTTTGSLSVSGGFVTTTSGLTGYAFTWTSGTATISPTCDSSGCTPAFGTSAVCADGSVGPDSTYASVVGLGINLNQTSEGGTAGTKALSSGVTVTATGVSTLVRVQITDASSNYWCVESGSWTSGTLIPITSFNTKCWDNTGTYATAGTAIQAVHLTVPSGATAANTFSMCITDLSAS